MPNIAGTARKKKRKRSAVKTVTKHIWFIAAAVFLLDQGTKLLVSLTLATGRSVSLIAHILSLTHVHNTGAAFGIFKNGTIAFVVISIIAVLTIIFYVRRKPPGTGAVNAALALILGGACGNMVDRLRLGYVIDFIDIHVWPVFNIADSAISIGTVLLLACMIRERKR
jgi:signal peptidase II